MDHDEISLDQMVDDDYAPEREMGAVDDELDIEPPMDPPVGASRAEVPEAAGDDEPLLHETYGDEEISARVRRLLRGDSATSMLRIRVTTEDGVVTLHGQVQTLDDTDNAAEVAARVEGVVDVIDELEVEP